jgi:hypothetical protein
VKPEKVKAGFRFARLPGIEISKILTMSNMTEKISLFVDRLVREALKSGLSVNEAVTAFGMASKATAVAVAKLGDGNVDDCVELARKRVEEGFAQPVHVIVAGADLQRLREAYQDVSDADVPTFENCNTRVFMPHLQGMESY